MVYAILMANYIFIFKKNISKGIGLKHIKSAILYLKTFCKSLRNHCRIELGQVSYVHQSIDRSKFLVIDEYNSQ